VTDVVAKLQNAGRLIFRTKTKQATVADRSSLKPVTGIACLDTKRRNTLQLRCEATGAGSYHWMIRPSPSCNLDCSSAFLSSSMSTLRVLCIYRPMANSFALDTLRQAIFS
jgi:hypothetical protein